MKFTALEYTALLSLSAAIFGAILITLILYGNKYTSARFLALFFFTLFSSDYLFFLFESRYLLQMPFLFRVGPLISYLLAPSMFFYILFVLDLKKKLRWWDALHLLPALVFLVDYFPLYLSSNVYKRQIIEALYQNKQQALLFQEGWLIPAGFHYPLRHLIVFLYIFYLAYVLVKFNREDKKKSQSSKPLLRWIMTILLLTFLLSLMSVVTTYFSFSSYAWIANIWSPLIISTALGVALLFQPAILYGSFRRYHTKSPGGKLKLLNLPEETFSKVKEKLDEYIENRHYLRKNIKLKEVADELNIQSYILSAYINQVYHFRFTDLINWCRIEYILKEGLLSSQKSLLTLEGIAEAAGFTNRTTFLNAFKKATGMTPTAYLRRQKKKELPEKSRPDKEQA